MQRLNLLLPLLLPALLAIIAFSCKKSSTHSIVGNWSIIDDSTKFVASSSAYSSYHSDYIGQPGDYYNFSTNGMMYVKEGAARDTMAYAILSNGQVRCTPSPGFTENYNASEITATTATFNIIVTRTDGELTKLIHLRK
jgi:hypothetical protein